MPRRKYIRFSFLMTLGLVIVWVMLVGEFTIGALVFGVVVAVFVQLVFPMPVIPQMARMRIHRLVWLVLVTLWGLLKASFVVAAQVLAFKRPTMNSVVYVDLRSKDSFTSTMTAVLVTLVPGSVVLEVQQGRLLVHVFDTQNQEAVDHAKAGVMKQEALVLRAFGNEREVEMVREEARERRLERRSAS